MGRTSCNVARAVGASRLRQLESIANFAQGPWKRRIAEAGQNPVILGFLVEWVVLGTLAQGRTLWAGEDFPVGGQKVDKFSGPLPPSGPHRNRPTIYIPTTYNYGGVDAILAIRPKLRKHELKEGTKAVVVGVQVTIPQSHSDSEASFMRNWRGWDTVMGCDRIEFRFLWIVEDLPAGKSSDWENVTAGTRTLRSQYIDVHPEYRRRYVSIMDFDNSIGEQLKIARKTGATMSRIELLCGIR